MAIIYLIQTADCILKKPRTYKIGCSERDGCKRLNDREYRGADIICVKYVTKGQAKKVENLLIKYLKCQFLQDKSQGPREWFISNNRDLIKRAFDKFCNTHVGQVDSDVSALDNVLENNISAGIMNMGGKINGNRGGINGNRGWGAKPPGYFYQNNDGVCVYNATLNYSGNRETTLLDQCGMFWYYLLCFVGLLMIAFIMSNAKQFW